MSDVLEQLIDMSQSLGDPANDYVILGEGNTSVRADDDSFWVKASGTELVRASRDSFVRVRFADSGGLGRPATDGHRGQAVAQDGDGPGGPRPVDRDVLARLVPAARGHRVRRAYASRGRRFAAVQPPQPRIVLRMDVPPSGPRGTRDDRDVTAEYESWVVRQSRELVAAVPDAGGLSVVLDAMAGAYTHIAPRVLQSAGYAVHVVDAGHRPGLCRPHPGPVTRRELEAAC